MTYMARCYYLEGPSAFTSVKESPCLLQVSHEVGGRRAQHLADKVDLIIFTGSREEWPTQIELS